MAKRIVGTVVSDKQAATIVVEAVRVKMHPIYRKQYKVTKRFQAHDAENTAKNGDKVEIEEVKPISKNKRFSLVSVITESERGKK